MSGLDENVEAVASDFLSKEEGLESWEDFDTDEEVNVK